MKNRNKRTMIKITSTTTIYKCRQCFKRIDIKELSIVGLNTLYTLISEWIAEITMSYHSYKYHGLNISTLIKHVVKSTTSLLMLLLVSIICIPVDIVLWLVSSLIAFLTRDRCKDE